MTPSLREWQRLDYALAAIIMALMGAFFWAIRGSAGYGGETGALTAGLGWALIWYAFSRFDGNVERRPYGSPWLLVAIAFGIGLGGFTGYGVYIAWLRGEFFLNYPEGARSISPWTGYAMLFLCGLHWGGNAGCFMAWCAPERPLRGRDWAIRIACGVCGAIAAWAFARAFPQLFLPFYGEGLYSDPANKTCLRAENSILTIAPHVGLFLGFLAYEILRKDRRAAALIVTLALGFAIPFALGGYWHTLRESALRIDWWKNWEMSIGLGGGLSFGIAFWLFNRPTPTPATLLGPKAVAFFHSGFPLWLPTVTVLQGAYDGWCEIHSVKPAGMGYALLLAVSTLPFLVSWGLSRKAGRKASFELSTPSILAFQLLIICMGYTVSIPTKWQPGNVFLVTIYACYIGGSLALLGALRMRRGKT